MPKPSKDIIQEIAIDASARAATLLPFSNPASLLIEEIKEMVIKLGQEFGVDLDKTAADEILTVCGYAAGGISILDEVKFSDPLAIPAMIATVEGIIKAAGNLVYDYFDEKYG